MSAHPPGVLRIGNHEYSVAWGPVETDDGKFLYGRTKPRQTLMEINDQVAASQQRDTLLHEVLHAIFSDTVAGLDHDHEEQVVRLVTPLLLQALRDNPDLVFFLLG